MEVSSTIQDSKERFSNFCTECNAVVEVDADGICDKCLLRKSRMPMAVQTAMRIQTEVKLQQRVEELSTFNPLAQLYEDTNVQSNT